MKEFVMLFGFLFVDDRDLKTKEKVKTSNKEWLVLSRIR